MSDTPTENGDLHDRAMALLAAEKAALKGADFTRLERLCEEKHELMQRVEAGAGALTRPQLEALVAASRVNERLLDAARRGLRAVARRLGETRRAAEHLDTYTRKGRRQDLGPARPSVERRA